MAISSRVPATQPNAASTARSATRPRQSTAAIPYTTALIRRVGMRGSGGGRRNGPGAAGSPAGRRPERVRTGGGTTGLTTTAPATAAAVTAAAVTATTTAYTPRRPARAGTACSSALDH
jgi:hypothetical protein